MSSESDLTAEQRAAWRVQMSVHLVLGGVKNGMVNTYMSGDLGVLGHVDHAVMVLTDATPHLIVRHASLVDRIRAGMRDARVRRRPQAWATLTACQEQLAALSGCELPAVAAAAPYLSPPQTRCRVAAAPERLTLSPSDGPMVFLAGGIRGCPDFRAGVIAALADDHVVLVNPRRPVFDAGAPDAMAEQARWEYEFRWHESLAYMLFWFPASSSSQPIAMLELGEALARPDLPIVVGANQAFPRYHDVVLQCGTARPEVKVHQDLDSVIGELQRWLRWQPI